MTLPRTLWFEGVSRGMLGMQPPGSALPYARIGFRPPRRGEHYVSGAIPCAYRAPNDLGTAFLIVRPLLPPKPLPTPPPMPAPRRRAIRLQ